MLGNMITDWYVWNNMLKVAERLIVAVSPEGPILRIYWWTLEYQMKLILNQTSAFFGWNGLTSRIILLTNHCWLADEACQSLFGPTSCSLPLCFQNNCHRLSAGDFGKHNKTKWMYKTRRDNKQWHELISSEISHLIDGLISVALVDKKKIKISGGAKGTQTSCITGFAPCCPSLLRAY